MPKKKSNEKSGVNSTILADDYFQIDVIMGKFRFKVPARGYNLKSMLNFQKSLHPHVTAYTYKKINKDVYDKLIYGSERK